MLNTLGQQLDRIENINNTKIEETSTSASTSQASTSQSKKIDIEENPIFIPYTIDTPINIGEQESILKEINEKLLKLNINNINEDDMTDHEMTDLEEQFKDNFEINKIKYNTYVPTPESRNYYNRPTLPDMGFEERNSLSQAHYSGTEIYEWNIDGHTEHQISNLLQEMTMAANAYKAHKNNELQIVQHLIAGFTGTLKGWWDSYLTEAEKFIILNAKKTIITNVNNMQTETQIEDMTNTLIFAILKNFVGDPTAYQERNSVILLNLTCRKLSDFRWYKDVFITKVMTRPDCREAYWKERFIAGLPRLFAEKKINELKISDELKQQIMKIMINEETSDSSISDFEENDLNIVEDESTSNNESEECECIGNCNCDYKEINTIQEDDEIQKLSDLIGKVEDTEFKKNEFKKD
ncbi:hypothetical protein Tco_0742702 [Tanacetum coccineum]